MHKYLFYLFYLLPAVFDDKVIQITMYHFVYKITLNVVTFLIVLFFPTVPTEIK